MKASAFGYARATSVSNVLQLLVSHGDKAKMLSGGQSLMPAMNPRLISPDPVVDIGQIAELRGVAVTGNALRIGAVTDMRTALDPETPVIHPSLRERGQLTNADMADYPVPMSGQMPDIDVGHGASPAFESELGANGAGEVGTAGAAAAAAHAVNDALTPFGVTITEIPLTPQAVLTALGRI